MIGSCLGGIITTSFVKELKNTWNIGMKNQAMIIDKKTSQFVNDTSKRGINQKIIGGARMNERANVLVMGNSGSGKSTLINAVFNFEQADVGVGEPVTKKMMLYETEEMNFRAIDTKGIEYGLLAQIETKNEIKKWTKESVKKLNKNNYIHMIWYCVDATSKRFTKMDLDFMKNVAKMWGNIPIIIVLTKSYSETEKMENIQMIRDSIKDYKVKDKLNIIDIVPVVALQFPVTDETIIAPIGVDELIKKTNDALPEAFKINNEAVQDLSLRIKRVNATTLVVTATTGALVVGAVTIPIADSAVLVPMQSGLIFGILKIYGATKEEDSLKKLRDAILSTGAVSMAARTIVSSLKAIPGINIAGAVINAVVAGIITAVLGEITITVMENIAKGEIDIDDIDWIKNFSEAQYMNKVGKYLVKLGKNVYGKDPMKVGEIIGEILKEFGSKKSTTNS